MACSEEFIIHTRAASILQFLYTAYKVGVGSQGFKKLTEIQNKDATM